MTRVSTLAWDDIKIFLAMVRSGNVRAAALALHTSHSTVARRLVALEKQLGVRLFDRTTSGYKLAAAGTEILPTAESMEREMLTLERRIVGRDQKLKGHVRVATVDFFATHLLIPSLTEFSRQYPDIEVEVVTTYRSLNLEKREADIALRVTANPPPQLVGQRLSSIVFMPYASREYLRKHDLQSSTACWIGYQSNATESDRAWVHGTAYPHLPVRGVFQSLLLQQAAARSGFGIAMLPCLLGDTDPSLVRLAAGSQTQSHDVWLLTHRDVRTTARLRALMQFIAAAVKESQALLEGRQGGVAIPR